MKTMNRKCLLSEKEFLISDNDLESYNNLGLPEPKLHPLERQRRRTSFRNFRHLYNRLCSATGKNIISMYHEKQAFPVYDNNYWWSDHWEAKDFGREFNFNKLFFDQYQELSNVVPRFALATTNSENCNYINMCVGSKNCYLVFGCVRNEDCLYGHIVWDSSNCLDNLYIFRCQWCSNSIDLFDCYDLHFSQECTNCQECYFLENCHACRNCFGCFNLKNAQYCFFNEQLSEKAYKEQLAKLLPLNQETIDQTNKYLQERRNSSINYPEYFGLKNEDVQGNHIYESSNINYSFDLKIAENCSYCFTGYDIQNCLDLSFTGTSARFCCECLTMFNAEECFYSHFLQDSQNAYYSEFCKSSKNIFGCNGLRNSEYCILNKQYSKDDYFVLKEKIIEFMKNTGEWGEFFPSDISPFAYNESIAYEYQPLTKEEVIQRGLKWLEEATYPEKEWNPSLGEINPQTVFYCSKSYKAYKLSKYEIEFYQRMNLSVPQLCPDQRHLQRMSARAARELFLGNCFQCKKEIMSANFSLSKRVFCEDCFTKE